MCPSSLQWMPRLLTKKGKFPLWDMWRHRIASCCSDMLLLFHLIFAPQALHAAHTRVRGKSPISGVLGKQRGLGLYNSVSLKWGDPMQFAVH